MINMRRLLREGLMVVGVMSVFAQLHSPLSLKDKRRIVKSALAKVQNKFNMSAAEVDFQDEWHREIGRASCRERV